MILDTYFVGVHEISINYVVNSYTKIMWARLWISHVMYLNILQWFGLIPYGY